MRVIVFLFSLFFVGCVSQSQNFLPNVKKNGGGGGFSFFNRHHYSMDFSELDMKKFIEKNFANPEKIKKTYKEYMNYVEDINYVKNYGKVCENIKAYLDYLKKIKSKDVIKVTFDYYDNINSCKICQNKNNPLLCVKEKVDSFEYALGVAEKIYDFKDISRIYKKLYEIYNNAGDDANAKIVLLKKLKNDKEYLNDELYELFFDYDELLFLSDLNEAKNYINKLLYIYNSEKNSFNINTVSFNSNPVKYLYMDLYNYYLSKKKYRLAEKYLNLSYRNVKKTNYISYNDYLLHLAKFYENFNSKKSAYYYKKYFKYCYLHKKSLLNKQIKSIKLNYKFYIDRMQDKITLYKKIYSYYLLGQIKGKFKIPYLGGYEVVDKKSIKSSIDTLNKEIEEKNKQMNHDINIQKKLYGNPDECNAGNFYYKCVENYLVYFDFFKVYHYKNRDKFLEKVADFIIKKHNSKEVSFQKVGSDTYNEYLLNLSRLLYNEKKYKKAEKYFSYIEAPEGFGDFYNRYYQFKTTLMFRLKKYSEMYLSSEKALKYLLDFKYYFLLKNKNQRLKYKNYLKDFMFYPLFYAYKTGDNLKFMFVESVNIKDMYKNIPAIIKENRDYNGLVKKLYKKYSEYRNISKMSKRDKLYYLAARNRILIEISDKLNRPVTYKNILNTLKNYNTGVYFIYTNKGFFKFTVKNNGLNLDYYNKNKTEKIKNYINRYLNPKTSNRLDIAEKLSNLLFGKKHVDKNTYISADGVLLKINLHELYNVQKNVNHLDGFTVDKNKKKKKSLKDLLF